MATEPKRQEPDIPPQKPDIQPVPRPQEIPQDKDFPEKNLRLCSFSDFARYSRTEKARSAKGWPGSVCCQCLLYRVDHEGEGVGCFHPSRINCFL